MPAAVPGMADDPLTEQYRALLERIARYPVTDPAARAAILAEIERQYRDALRAVRREQQPGELARD